MQSKCLTNGVTSPKENLKPVFNERCKVSEAKRSDVSYDSAFDVVRKTSYAKSVFNKRCNILIKCYSKVLQSSCLGAISDTLLGMLIVL